MEVVFGKRIPKLQLELKNINFGRNTSQTNSKKITQDYRIWNITKADLAGESPAGVQAAQESVRETQGETQGVTVGPHITL